MFDGAPAWRAWHRAPGGRPAGAGHAGGGGAELWAWLGIAHLRAGRPDAAAAAFERALELEPNYNWVSYVLLPEARGG